jgi:uncharacterized FlaG/YvyC family protein
MGNNTQMNNMNMGMNSNMNNVYTPDISRMGSNLNMNMHQGNNSGNFEYSTNLNNVNIILEKDGNSLNNNLNNSIINFNKQN